MPRFLPAFVFLFSSTSYLAAQNPPPPQTARQALIEMFFGTTPNHMEKHLPDETRKVFKKFNAGNGASALDQFSMFASMAKASGKLQTFDTGPTLIQVEDPRDGSKAEISVEADNLGGDEDEIELSLHLSKSGQEQLLPFVPRFTFVMRTDSDVWRLNEISVTVRVPLTDPTFLKNVEDHARRQNEEVTIWAIRSIGQAEKTYQGDHNAFACSLAALNADSKQNVSKPVNLDPELARGKKNGYVFAITGCDGTHYKIAAEPAVSGSGDRAFCADESGVVRASADGKATTCLAHGEPADAATGATAIGFDALSF